MRTESFEKFLGPIGYDEPMAKTKPDQTKPEVPAQKPIPRFEIPTEQPDESEFTMKASEAAEILGVDAKTLTNWAAKEKIPSLDLGELAKPRYRFRPADIEARKIKPVIRGLKPKPSE